MMTDQSKKLRVLYLEDDPLDVELTLTTLKAHGYQVDSTAVLNKKEFLNALENETFDIVLADYNLPTFDGMSALKLFRQHKLDIPFILVSGTMGEERAIESLKAGAVDYVLKTSLNRLGPVVERALREAAEHRQRRSAEEELKKNQQQLQLLFDNVIDVIWQMDLKLNFTYISPSVFDMTGFTQEEWLGTNLSEHASPKEFLKMAKHAFDGIKDYKTFKQIVFEGVMLRKDKTEVPVEINGKLLLNDRGFPYGLQGSTRDITERLKLQRQARHYLDQQVATNQLARGLGEILEIPEIYQIIYTHISQLMTVDSFAISLYQPEEKLIQVKFAMNDGNLVDVGTIPPFPILQYGKGRQGDVIHTGEPLYIDDYQKTLKKSKIDDSVTEHRKETRLSLGKERKVQSALYAPMKSQGETIGVMQVQSYQTDAYSQDDIDLLCSMATVASISIQNAKLIQNLAQANQEIAEAYDSTLEGWAKALELRDMETEGHSRRVVNLTIRLAQKMGISGEKLVEIQRGALLHDIGKMSVPDSILQKPGKLTDDEWVIMRQHPIYAYDWLSSIKYLEPCLDIPRYHHEKWDGSGYPHGLQGEQIPLSARIFAIVDVWDALLSDRPYRDAWSKDRAIDYIAFHSEDHFDPQVAKAFLGMVAGDKDLSE